MKWPWWHQHDWRIVDASAYETWHSPIQAYLELPGHKITKVLYRCAGCRKFRVERLDGEWRIGRDGDAEEATLKKIVG